MKALSCKPYWAGMIAGLIPGKTKTLEIRSRPTHYRGELLICASQRPEVAGVPAGHAVCTVRVVGCHKMKPEDSEAAGGVACAEGLWAWELADVRPVAAPFPVKGRLGFYDVEMPVVPSCPTGAESEMPVCQQA